MSVFFDYLAIASGAILWGLGAFELWCGHIRQGLFTVFLGVLIVLVNMYLGGFLVNITTLSYPVLTNLRLT